MVYTVYLANAFCNVEQDILSYDLLNKRVLNLFGLKSEEQFNLTKKKLEDAFERERADRSEIYRAE